MQLIYHATMFRLKPLVDSNIHFTAVKGIFRVARCALAQPRLVLSPPVVDEDGYLKQQATANHEPPCAASCQAADKVGVHVALALAQLLARGAIAFCGSRKEERRSWVFGRGGRLLGLSTILCLCAPATLACRLPALSLTTALLGTTTASVLALGGEAHSP